MRSLTRTEWIIQIILCNLLLVLGGVFAIYYIECRANLHSRDLAQTAAADISKQEPGRTPELENPDQYLTYSVFYQEIPGETEPAGGTSASGLSPEAADSFRAAEGRDDIWAAESAGKSRKDGKTRNPSPDQPALRKLRAYYGQKDLQIDSLLPEFANYVVQQKPFYAMQTIPCPPALVSVAGQPAAAPDGRMQGYVYVARLLPSVPLLMLAYSAIVSLLYYAIVAALISQRRSRDRIEQIYHQYIANISHELKTPIASIQAITEILNDGRVHDETTLSRYYGIISRESRLLEHSVLQIIELSKLQDQKLQFKKAPVSPHALLDPIYERFSSRCEDADISFYIDDSVWALPDFYTDAFRLTQLLEILLDNAYKFVGDEGHIFIDATSKYGQATLRINDDGRGISAKDYPHIFERFYKTAVDNPTGSGLGLAIAREIVDGLGEQIWVQSEEGRGTIFFVTVATRT